MKGSIYNTFLQLLCVFPHPYYFTCTAFLSAEPTDFVHYTVANFDYSTFIDFYNL